MARGRQTLTQRIALDGGKEILKELEALGADGRRVFQRLSQAAEDTAEAGSRLNRFVADLRKRFEELREAGREVGRALNDVGREARRRFVSFGMARVILMSLLPGICCARPWKHGGSKRAKIAAGTCVEDSASRTGRSQLSHWECEQKGNSPCCCGGRH